MSPSFTAILSDAAGDVGADVDLGLGLDLAARRHRRDQVARADRLHADFDRLVLVAGGAQANDCADRNTIRPANSPSFMRRDMCVPLLPLLTERTAHRGFQRREGLVVIVNRVDVVTFGPLHRVLRIRHFERGPAAETVAVLSQPQLVSRGIPTLGLYRRSPCTRSGSPGSGSATSVCSCRRWARTRLLRVLSEFPRLLHLQRTAESGEDRKRNGQAGPEGLRGEIERELVVRIDHALADRGLQGRAGHIKTGQGVAVGSGSADWGLSRRRPGWSHW